MSANGHRPGRVIEFAADADADDADVELAPAIAPRKLVPTARQLEAGRAPVDPDSPAVLQPVPEERLPLRARLAGYARAIDPRGVEGDRRPFYIFSILILLTSFDQRVIQLIAPELQAEFAGAAAAIFIVPTLMVVVGYVVAPLWGWLADRVSRVWLVRVSYLGANVFTAASAFARGAGGFIAGQSAGGLLNQVNGPAQYSLLADYYGGESFGRVFTALPAVSALASITGPLVAAFVTAAAGWRMALFSLGIVGVAGSAAAFFLREPKRGQADLEEAGVDAAAPDEPVEAPPPLSFSESWRAARAVQTVRRIWWATPFTTAGTGGLNLVMILMLVQRFGLSPEQRGYVVTLMGVSQFAALLFAAPVAGRLLETRPGRIMTLVGAVTAAQAGVLVVLMVSHALWVSVIALLPLAFAAALVVPAQAGLMLQVIPSRIRGVGVTTMAPFQLLGLALYAVALQGIGGGGAAVERFGVSLIPMNLVGGLILMTASTTVARDMRAAKAATAAAAAAKEAQDAGRAKLLVCRDVDVVYDGTQVLFGVDLDIEEGEAVALVGTNGAGKSTLLRAISGVQEASNGAIVFDGEDITHEPAHVIAARNVVMMPGGQATFPTLTVDENLRAALWLRRDDEEHVRDRLEEVFGYFPVLRDRLNEPAGNLSGGEQQMVALGQAFLLQPRLLMIDELSLGLAPAVVERLLAILAEIHAAGTTVVLVEQSLNVAVSIAQRAVFMEKGEIRFDGPTAELLRQPDLVRSVFMGGAVSARSSAYTRRGRADGDGSERVLAVSGVEVSFGGIAALQGADLEARAGQVVGIIGPNGAGKTTLFDVISGFVRPDAGTVLLGDRDVTAASPDARSRLGLGRSFQNAKLFPGLTVRENIALALERRAVKSTLLAAAWAPPVRRSEAKIARRVEGLVEILGLEAFADKFASELSTGSRRAVEVACIMASEPTVLLLDEPSSGLAQAETEELGPVLLRLVRDTGCALVVIEHDMPLITSISDRLVAMELGRVVTSGTPDEVLADPRVLGSYLAASENVLARSGSAMTAIEQAMGAVHEQPGEVEPRKKTR